MRALWDAGHSAAEIGRRMRLTKNAIIGRAHRLHLAPRPSPTRAVNPAVPGKLTRQQEVALRAERAAAVEALARAQAAVAAAMPQASRVVHVGPAADCQWPTTTVGGRHRLECSNPCVGRRPYCAHHAALAYGRPQLAARTQERLVAVHG